MFAEPLTDWLTEMPADELATQADRRHHRPGAARRDPHRRSGRALRPTDFVLRAAAEPALHARHERLDLRRRLAQPDVLAGAPARDAERRGGLPLPPALPRRRLPDLVRRRRPRLGRARASRAATSCRPATASSSSAWASAAPRAPSASSRKNLFAAGAARLVIGAQMPRERAAMHLDTVFTFCDRERRDDLRAGRRRRSSRSCSGPTATAASRPRSRSGRSSTRSQTRSGIEELKLVTTGGDEFEAERNQWDDGNNVVALEPGVVVALRAERGDQREAREGRHRGARDRRPGARTRTRRRPLHDLSDRPRRLRKERRP